MTVRIRDARPRDVRSIASLVAPYAQHRILVPKELIHYFEDVQEFIVAEDAPDGPVSGRRNGGDPGGGQGVDEVGGSNGEPHIVGCGALHVMWDDIAEVRTLAVAPSRLHHGIGSALLEALLARVRALGLRRAFCLTFEVDFFARHGFHIIEGTPVGQDVFAEMLRSHDDGIKEFLDLASVKPNTLGNTRMLLELSLDEDRRLAH